MMTADEISQLASAKPGEDLDWQEDRTRLAATEIFVLAILGDYVPRSIWSLLAENLKLDAMAKAAYSEARYAKRLAEEAIAKLDGMRGLIRYLEERVNNLTPGIREPK